MKARQNLHEKWTTYLEASIKGWKSCAEDFATKDHDLEEKVNQAKETLQIARNHLDEIKDLHSKQDQAVLEDAEVTDSDADDEMKVETAEAIKQGILSMVDNLAMISTKARPPEMTEENAAKKAKLGDDGQRVGALPSTALEPFARPGKHT